MANAPCLADAAGSRADASPAEPEDGYVTAAAYGFGSALVYGVADIAGGLATRRTHVVTILVGAYASSLPIVLIAAILGGGSVPEPSALAWSVVGVRPRQQPRGCSTWRWPRARWASPRRWRQSSERRSRWRSESRAASVSHPLRRSGCFSRSVRSRSLPRHNDQPTPRIVGPPRWRSEAAVMFAISFIAFSQARRGSDPFWVAAIARVTGLAIVVLLAAVISQPLVTPRGLRRLVAVVGLLDATALVLLLMAYGGGTTRP